MGVKPGYKLSEVGVIPEDWVICCLGSLLRQGPTNGWSGRITSSTTGTPTLSLAATSSGRLVLNDETIKYLEDRVPGRSDPYLAPGDILVQRSNTADLVGTTAVFDGAADVFVYPDLMMRLRFRQPITGLWFWRYANSASGRSYFARIAAGSTGSMPKIGGSNLRAMPLPLPALAEQKAITCALSDADTLIESLERLTAKKRRLKRGAMHELLTGKKRLPGFSGEWDVKRLGEIAHIKTGGRNNEDKIEEGEYPFFVRSATVERINSYSYDGEAILIPGEGGIGSIFHYVHGRFDVHQRVYAITQFTPETSGRFVYFYMAEKFGVHAMQNSVKATVDSLRLPTFQNFEIVMPSTVAEQDAIAAVLSDMDAEIAALEAKLAKARQLKQGMMQELLTGRIRLV